MSHTQNKRTAQNMGQSIYRTQALGTDKQGAKGANCSYQTTVPSSDSRLLIFNRCDGDELEQDWGR